MASFKIKFRASTYDGDKGRLYYQITHKKIVRQFRTNYEVSVNEWDDESETINISDSTHNRKDYLNLIKRKIKHDKKRFETIVLCLSLKNKLYTTDDIIERFRNQITNSSFFDFMSNIIVTYKKHGQYRTSETYLSTLNSIRRFRCNKDIELADIDEEFIMSYENYLKSIGVQHNTISFYMHRLRAVYNKAVDQELIEQRHPFKHIKIGIEKTNKRAIPIDFIRKIKSLKLKALSSKDFARDMFLFSFYTRGMSFVDIAYLRKKDLKNGMLVYQRKKTGQKLFIHWELCMELITQKYKSKESSPYLFPILDESKGNVRKQYHNTSTLINRNLKILGKEIGLEIPLTMYVARHSWATTARNEGIPISIISEGMGHDSEKTTQIYLASLNNQVIDSANRQIIKLL